MNLQFEYQSKIEFSKVNVLLYRDAKYLVEFFPSAVLNDLPKEENCLLYNDFKTITIFVKLDTDLEKNRRLGAKAFSKLIGFKPKSISFLGEFNAEFLEGFSLSNYSFEELKSKKESKIITFVLDEKNQEACESIKTLANSVFWSRDLVNLPFNFLNASSFQSAIEKRFEKTAVKCTFWTNEKLKEENFGGLLSVNQASEISARFGILEYKHPKTTQIKPIVLVGKGVVYDTGGLSLKPTENSMDFMKCDMAGLAAVLGATDAIQEQNLPLWIVTLCPITDNLIGNKSFAPGDVITMRSGATVEVMDTDAEGRLILADALDYAKSLNPQLVIDAATLTGSAVRAIGDHAAALMGNANSALFHQISKIGEETGERVARFPFWEDYKEELKSEIADVKNLGGPTAGAITAGKFLEHFVAYEWLHLDIAGPAYLHKPWHYNTLGGTGFGVRLLVNFIKRIAQ